MRGLSRNLLLIAAGAAALFAADANWSQYLGAPEASQFSSLKQITKANVKQLEVAWTFPAGMGNYTFNPIVVDGVMYVLGKTSSTIVALDATTGRELWTHVQQGGGPTPRGFNFWQSKDKSDKRILYAAGGYLHAIDAKTGQTILSFGDNGQTDLKLGMEDRDLTNVRSVQSGNPGRIYDDIM